VSTKYKAMYCFCSYNQNSTPAAAPLPFNKRGLLGLLLATVSLIIAVL
ncbi:MAG: hypothetical protein ACI81P_002350, partial [Neolewinella sp.]